MSAVEIALLCGLALALVALVALRVRMRSLTDRIAVLDRGRLVAEGTATSREHPAAPPAPLARGGRRPRLPSS